MFCPLCAIKREIKAVRTYWDKYQALLKDNPNLRLYYLVLTVENEADFEKTFDKVQKAARLLIERRKDAKRARNGNKANRYALNSAFAGVEAGAYSFEVGRGKGSGLWHPHVNFLLVAENRIDIRALRKEWKSLCKDRSRICRIKEINGDDRGAFIEIFKYALKFSAMAPGDRFHTATALYRRNLFGSFGAFRGLKVENEDSIELKDLPYLDLLYRYNSTLKSYILDSITAKNVNPVSP